MRRFQRIYPTFIVCLLFAVLVYFQIVRIDATLLSHDSLPIPTGWIFLGNALLLQSTVVPAFFTIAPAWSLGIEAAYYVAALAFVKMSQRVFMGVLLNSAMFYFYTTAIHHENPFGNQRAVVALLWAWLLGWLAYKNATAKTRSRWIDAAVLLLPFALVYLNTTLESKLSVVPCAVASIVILYGHKLNLSAMAARVCSYLGEISYPLYLIHIPILYLILCAARPLAPLLVYPLCLGAAAIIYHCVEVPFRKKVRAAKQIQTASLQSA